MAGLALVCETQYVLSRNKNDITGAMAREGGHRGMLMSAV